MQAATGGTIVTLITLAILVLVGLGIITYFISIYNNLVRLKNMIDRSFADIDVVLKQRHDELPKLIETCKGYMQYEQKTLEAVIEARNGYAPAASAHGAAGWRPVSGGWALLITFSGESNVFASIS